MENFAETFKKTEERESRIERLYRDSERFHAILRYVESCTYSPEKKIIFAIAGVRPEKEVQEE